MHLRSATADDAPSIAAIYAEDVLHGTGTFEEVPPTPEDMRARIEKVQAAGFPWLVAERDQQILGYSYAKQFHERSAYRYCCENSIYLHPDAKGQGVGTALLGQLIEDCSRLGFTTMLAIIGDSANAASIGLHRKYGFVHVGTMVAVGYKFERWLDVVTMQLSLRV
jgi:L-amino acid N-acyltransferase YncA